MQRPPLLALSLAVAATLLTACVPSGPGEAIPQPATTLPSHSVTKPVPAPSGGTIHQRVASPTPQPTVAALADGVAKLGDGVSIRVPSVTATRVTARTPGEVDGSAVVVTVEVDNGGRSTASVDSAYVDVVASDGTFAVGTTAGKGVPFHGVVAPGATATATYVFMLSNPKGRQVTVTVSHAAGAPVARFTETVS